MPRRSRTHITRQRLNTRTDEEGLGSVKVQGQALGPRGNLQEKARVWVQESHADMRGGAFAKRVTGKCPRLSTPTFERQRRHSSSLTVAGTGGAAPRA